MAWTVKNGEGSGPRQWTLFKMFRFRVFSIYIFIFTSFLNKNENVQSMRRTFTLIFSFLGGPQAKLCTYHRLIKYGIGLKTNEVEHNLENRIRTSNMLKGLPQCSRMNLNYQVSCQAVIGIKRGHTVGFQSLEIGKKSYTHLTTFFMCT